MYAMYLQPGDMQILNNHVTLHARTEFEDYDDPVRKRCLFRLWLAPPDIFFFNDTATTEIYTLSLHDALPIYHRQASDRR